MNPQLDDIFSDDLPPDHRSGVVAVVGAPNVGKSTLINRLLAQKIAIVSPKPQTTRRRQLGILTDERGQILLIDTPGLHAPQHRLGEYMIQVAETAFREADAILVLIDGSEPPSRRDQYLAETVMRLRGATPVVLLINKADLIKPEQREERIAAYRALMQPDHALLVSALTGENVADLMTLLYSLMPLGPRYYPVDQVSDLNLRFMASEVIREKIIGTTDDELPYSVAVEIESYKERSETLHYISAIVYVEREGQKGILIGKNGAKIKEIGAAAREELEQLLEVKVFLELHVKVLKDWRSDENLLRRLGYRLPKDERD
ncbi:MAG: GTPase Era [Anaerolineae bacterium]|nr:GTPase Era [Anaerolineae bacterium]NUQ04240.1 GTPase Era [Anaerolineae bacterium]